jgi:hypothetical protein
LTGQIFCCEMGFKPREESLFALTGKKGLKEGLELACPFSRSFFLRRSFVVFLALTGMGLRISDCLMWLVSGLFLCYDGG